MFKQTIQSTSPKGLPSYMKSSFKTGVIRKVSQISMFIIDCVSIPMLLAFTLKKKKKITNAIRVVLEMQHFP